MSCVVFFFLFLHKIFNHILAIRYAFNYSVQLTSFGQCQMCVSEFLRRVRIMCVLQVLTLKTILTFPLQMIHHYLSYDPIQRTIFVSNFIKLFFKQIHTYHTFRSSRVIFFLLHFLIFAELNFTSNQFLN